MDERTRDNEVPLEEIAKRRDEALRRALNTPPQPKPNANPKRENPRLKEHRAKPSAMSD